MRRRTAMVVDDDDPSREVLSLMLEQIDLKVVGVRGGQAALDVLQHVRVDLILLDIRMPEMSGLQVLEALRERPAPRPPVIMTTASGDRADVTRAMVLGAAGYILKPVRADVLRARVTRQLDPGKVPDTAAYLSDDDTRRFRRI